MNKFYILILLSVFLFSCGKNGKPIFTENPNADKKKKDTTQNNSVKKDTTQKNDANNPAVEFDKLNTKVRDGLISQKDAQEKIKEFIPKITEYYKSEGGKEYTKDSWVFPLEGYGPDAIGGKGGNGYVMGGYNYFDGNKHTGHPAQDIFIKDANQDCIDDAKGKPVNVLSISGGVVIGTANSWQPESDLKGGIYVWIYDPSSNKIFYYAHNKEIFVKPGDTVKPGDLIAAVGRTGKNAYPKRSPSHLHLNYYSVKDGYPVPENPYEILLKAKRM
jgi:murein DD-endopeptidase MepM/ murein hydrolase activator NlpD